MVVSDRDANGVVGEDVGSHEDWIGKQPDTHGLLPFGLVLELRHSSQFAKGCDGAENPQQLGVGTYLALREQQATGRIQARRQEQHRCASGPCRQLARVVGHGHGVEVDDAEDRVVDLLIGDPMTYGAQVVSEMHVAGGLYP